MRIGFQLFGFVTNYQGRISWMIGFEQLFMNILVNISSVVEFQRWWVLKSKLFVQESTCSKEIVVFCEYEEHQIVKKCRNRTFKINFLCQKSMEFFLRISIQETIFCKQLFFACHTLQPIIHATTSLWSVLGVLSISKTLLFSGFTNPLESLDATLIDRSYFSF